MTVETVLAGTANELVSQSMNPSVLQRIAAGDSTAVRECIDRFGALVWSLARRLSRTAADAEDATQEIFLDIWRSAARFDASQGSEKVFVAMIARRRLIDRLRKTTAEPVMDSVDDLESVTWCDPGTASEVSLEARLCPRRDPQDSPSMARRQPRPLDVVVPGIRGFTMLSFAPMRKMHEPDMGLVPDVEIRASGGVRGSTSDSLGRSF